MTQITMPSACSVVPSPVASPTRGSLLWMSQSATCRFAPSNAHLQSSTHFRQVNPVKYNGLLPTIKTLVREEGSTGIWKGFGPTFVGYSAQGMFKYGLYEIFKDFYSNLAGEELSNAYKPAIWLAGSASAEVFADIALCPLEMTKVKIQTSPTGTFPTAFGAAIKEMSRTRVDTRYPFGSLVPLWSRQVCRPLPTDAPQVLTTSHRSRTPWPSSSSLKRLCSSSIPMSSRSPKNPTGREHNSELHLGLGTSLVSSAPSSRTLPIPSFLNSVNQRIKANRSVRLPPRSASCPWPQKGSELVLS